MKKTLLVVAVAACALFLWLAVYWWNRSEIHLPPISSETELVTKNRNTGDSTAPRKSEIVTRPLSATSQRTEIDANDYRRNLLSMWQVRIDFYGKVVDETGLPVEAADVVFGWSEMPAYEGSGNTSSARSDENGLFSLVGEKGPNLTVRVSKDGYYTSRKNRTGFSYALGDESFSPNQSDPVVFHLKKKGQGVHLITSENGIRAKLSVRVSKTNSSVRVNLLEKKATTTGQLEISQIKPPWRDATNWSFRLSIPDGGFVKNDDEFPFEAPESNYFQTIEYNFTKGTTNWTTQASEQFYITFGQPRKYGWLRIESNLAQETVFLTYAINLSGSRNLEYDEAAQPKPTVHE